MKTLIAISMVLLVLSGPVYAGSGRSVSYLGSSSGAITGINQVVSSTRGVNIYNLTLNAGASNASLAIYDSNVFPFTNSTQETVIYEIEVATAGNSASVDFSTAPLQTYSGLVASAQAGTAFINKE